MKASNGARFHAFSVALASAAALAIATTTGCGPSDGGAPSASSTTAAAKSASGANATSAASAASASASSAGAAPPRRFQRVFEEPPRVTPRPQEPDWPDLLHSDMKVILAGHFRDIAWKRERVGMANTTRPQVAVGGAAPPLVWADKLVRWTTPPTGDTTPHPSFHRFTGTSWERIPIEGWPRAMVRLESGSTLVTADKVYEVDKAGAPIAIEEVSPDAVPVRLAGTVWLIDTSGPDPLYFKPIDATAYRPAAPRRIATSAAVKVPNPARYTEECKTPFLHIVSPPSKGWDYETTRAGLSRLEDVQSQATFVEYEAGGVAHFGAQCTTKEVADKITVRVTAMVTSLKPVLQCLDVVSVIPDPDNPPENARIVDIDLFSGAML